jgi:hypothetical protein
VQEVEVRCGTLLRLAEVLQENSDQMEQTPVDLPRFRTATVHPDIARVGFQMSSKRNNLIKEFLYFVHMPSLGEMSIDYGGEVEVPECHIRAISQVPYALWEATVNLRLSKVPFSPGQLGQAQTQYGVEIGNSVLKLYYNGKPIAESFTEPFHVELNFENNFALKIHMPVQALQFIEKYRQDDVQLEFQMVGNYFIFPQNNPQGKTLKQYLLLFQKKFTQKEWIGLLRETGYSDKWIIEIDRPKIEGYNTVLEFLDKAGNELFDKKDPAGVLAELRKAWNSLEPLIKNKRNEIDERIDRGSPGEKDEPKKSERIDDIRTKLRKFLQIGPHESEGYSVFYSDALLAYRLSLSLLQYYSELLGEIEK